MKLICTNCRKTLRDVEPLIVKRGYNGTMALARMAVELRVTYAESYLRRKATIDGAMKPQGDGDVIQEQTWLELVELNAEAYKRIEESESARLRKRIRDGFLK